MAVNLDIAGFFDANPRIATSEAVRTELAPEVQRFLTAATELVNKHAPDAPESVANTAVIRLVMYWYDAETSPAGMRYGRPFHSSGAAAILAPWRKRRAGRVADAD